MTPICIRGILLLTKIAEGSSLMKSKLSQSPRTRNILTLSWRILAASTLFLIFFLVKKIGLKVMAYNPYLQNVAGFWSAEKFLRVIFCLSFFSYFSLLAVGYAEKEKFPEGAPRGMGLRARCCDFCSDGCERGYREAALPPKCRWRRKDPQVRCPKCRRSDSPRRSKGRQ